MSEETLDSGQNDTETAGGETQALEAGNTLLGGDQAADEQAAAGDNAADESDNSEAEGEADGEDKGEQGEVPESYEFNMPEGWELDAPLVEAVSPVLKKYGVTQEDAQSLADALTNSRQAGADALAEAQAAHFNQQLEDWAEELRTDNEIGGERFGENAKVARDAIEKFGSPELTQLLNETGYGNNPALFKFALNVGRFLSEDQPGRGNAAQGEVPQELRMYNPDGSPKRN